LRLVLLRLIADQPRHGYDLIQSIEEMTGGAYAPSPGVVYRRSPCSRTWA
jgi:DNA-binding PadR family transcriptional regulator